MELLPTTNADGRDVVPMTGAQKYLFDLKGFVLVARAVERRRAGADSRSPA